MTTPQDETPGLHLPAEVTPPAGLEGRVLRGLARRGLLKRAPRSPGVPWWTGALAATLAAFALGWVTGHAGARVEQRPAGVSPVGPAPTAATGQQYLLLLSADAPRAYTTQERWDLYQEYAAWADRLYDAGRLVAAEELAEGGVLLWRDVVKPVVMTESTPGGFFLVTARDSAEALAIARDSPHWRRGGTIAIRPVRRD